MISLHRPVPGVAESSSADTRQCGRLATDAALRVLLGGEPDDWAPDNATAGQLRDSINNQHFSGIEAIVADPKSDPMTLLSEVIPQGRYLIIGVNCTGQCVLTPYYTGVTHWVTAFSTEGDYFNCWHNTFERISLSAPIHNTQMGSVILWRDGVSPVDNPIPTPPGHIAEAQMASVETFEWGNTQRYIFVDATGHLYHNWVQAGKWNREEVKPSNGVALPAMAPVTVKVLSNGQLDVRVNRGTSIFHAYQLAGTGTWHVEEE